MPASAGLAGGHGTPARDVVMDIRSIPAGVIAASLATVFPLWHSGIRREHYPSRWPGLIGGELGPTSTSGCSRREGRGRRRSCFSNVNARRNVNF